MLDGRFSITKATVKKTMNRFTSENSMRNALSFAIAVLSTHFVIGEGELEKNEYDQLSDDAKSTIDLVKKLNGYQKVLPIDPDQILSTDDATLFMHSGTAEKKDNGQLWILKL